ncbi:MAG: nuclear transport factor 2 family protein [Verrucomicrobiaceae bacterium]
MKHLILFTFLGMAAMGLGQSNPPAHSATTLDDNAEITKLREWLTDCFNSGDVNRLTTLLDPDVVVTWQNGEVCRGPEAVHAYYNRMMTGDQRIVRKVTVAPEVLGRQVNGDWAISWGNLHDHFMLMDGSDLPFNTLFTMVTVKHGDHWLVKAYHASVNAFDNPALGLAIHKTALWTGIGAGAAGLIAGFLLARVLGGKRSSAA